jgi:hypothetical protein
MDRLMHRYDFGGWLPLRAFFRDEKVMIDWAYFGERRLSEPFYRDSAAIAMRLPFNQAFRRETTADEMVAWATTHPGVAPTAFIFHASRCGSTLMSQMLAALPSHIVVSEPPMLDTLLRAHYFVAGLAERDQIAYVRALVIALAQPRYGETEFAIKLDAWDIFDLPLLRKAFPDTPWIFLYRDPLEIAVSQIRQRGAYMVPGIIGPAQFLINPDEAALMCQEEYIARVLGQILAQAVQFLPNANGRAVHYRQLPVAMWSELASLFGVGDLPASREMMQHAAKWDAKNPYFEFASDSESKQREATPILREFIDQWASPHYLALERLRAQSF